MSREFARGSRDVDPAELHFLLLHFLAAGPCQSAAKVLEEEAVAKGLLPSRTDIFGVQHSLSYAELQERYAHMPASAIADMLHLALVRKRDAGMPGVTSILHPGKASVVPSLAAEAYSTAVRKLPGWLRAPHLNAPMVQRLKLRQIGASAAARSQRALLPPAAYAGEVQHQRSVRGHSAAVYCVTFDRLGNRLITGSDDTFIKIWSTETALLLCTCRGHRAEVTDLAVNVDNTLFASSSNDHTVRCWSLEPRKLGETVSLLTGHRAVVSFVEFCPVIPHALLSCSFDGTCRIWNARNATAEPLVLSATPNFAASPSHSTRGAQEAQAVHPPMVNPAENTIIGAEDSHVASIPGIPGLLVCAFSKDGAYIVSGANDCNTYIWHWDLWASSDSPPVRSTVYSATSLADGLRQPKWAPGAAAGAVWPQPQEVCRLMGHRHDVLLLQFSHDGESIATGSKDGSVRVWRRERKRNSGKGWMLEATFACLPDPEEVRQASKRRRPPPSPSVNQIAWSCDDTKILASVTDSSVRVWDTRTGEPLYELREHKGDAFVLECHPTDSRIAISGAYDGTICMWDLATGKKMASFSTQDTCPGGRRWVDPIPMLDGHFTPDGSGFVVTDVAGQVHLYATDTPAATSHVPYDQFFIQELRPVPPPLPAEGEPPAPPQEPAPFRPHTHMLCDSLVNIYPDPFQRAFQTGRVSALPPLCVLEVSELPSGIVQNNPVVTAAAWTAQEHGGSEAAIQNAMQRAQQRMLNADEEFMRATEPRPAGAQRSAAAARATAAAALYDSDVAEMEIGAVSDGDYADDSEFTGNGEADSDADFDSDQVEEEAPLERVPAPSRRYRSAPALSTRAHERVPLPEPAAPRYRTRRHGDVEEPEQLQLRSRRPRRVAARNQRGAATIPSDDESDAELAAAIAASAHEQTMLAGSPEATISSDDDAGPSPGASIPLPPLPSAPHTRPGGTSSRIGTADRGSRISAREKRQRDREEAEARASKRRRTVRRRAEDDYAASEDDDGVDSNVDSEEEYSEGSELDEKVEEEEAEEGDMEDSEDEAARAVEAQRRVEARERRAGLLHSQEEATKPGAADAMPRGLRGAKPREAHMYEWLQVAQQVPSVYVPQMGDEVVYLRTGHQRFLDSQNDKRPPPWEYLTAKSGNPLREAEPCTVVGLSYLIADDGMDATYASLKLRLDDTASLMKGGHFYVRLPPPFVGGADFVVPKSRFDAAIRRKWTIDDHCQVYYPDEVKFWNGIVINDNREGGEDQVQADPYSSGGLWERFTVTWDSTVVNPGAAAPSDDHISPWEMFDAGLDSDHVLEEAPTISLELRTRLLAAVKRVVREPRFEIFASSPGINVYYSGSSTDRLFYNRRVPLPLALTEVEARLSSLYYRQPAAVSQDLKVIYENAVSFNGADSVIAKDARDLMERLQSVVEGNPLPAAQPEVGAGLQSTRRRLPVGALAERGFSAPSEMAARRARISIRMPSGSILGTDEDAALSEVAGIGLLPAPTESPARNQSSNPPYPEQSRVARARGRPRRGTNPSVPEPVPSPRRQRRRRVYHEAYDSGSEDVEVDITPPRHNARQSLRSRRHDRHNSPEVIEPPVSESRRPQRAAAAAARFKFEYGGSDEELASEDAPIPPRGRPQRTVRMADLPPQPVVAPTVQQPDLSSVVLLSERPEHGYSYDLAELPSSAGQGGPSAGVPDHEGGWTDDVRRGKRSSRSRAHPEIHGFEMGTRMPYGAVGAATGQPVLHTLGEGSWPNLAPRPSEGGYLPGVSGRGYQDRDPWAGQASGGYAAEGSVPTPLPTAEHAAEPDLMDTSDPVRVSAAHSDFEYHSAGSGLASDSSGGARAGISNGLPSMDGLQTAALPSATHQMQNGRSERLDTDLLDTQPRQPLRIKLKLPHLV